MTQTSRQATNILVSKSIFKLLELKMASADLLIAIIHGKLELLTVNQRETAFGLSNNNSQ